MSMTAFYIITLLGACLIARQSVSGICYSEDGSLTRREMSHGAKLVIFYFIFLIGFRYMNYDGSDEWIYRLNNVRIFSVSSLLRRESLSNFLQFLSYKMSLHTTRAFAYGQLYVLVTSIIIVVLFVTSIWDYSDNFLFSIFLFITMGFLFTSMNIIRQYVAVAILFFGYRYMQCGEFKKYLICVILATGFHTSAIIMLPLYFIVRKRAFSIFAVFGVIALMLFLSRVKSVGLYLFGDTQYGHYFENEGSRGANYLRVLSGLIPCIVIVISRHKLLNLKSQEDICNMNMIMLTIAVLILSTVDLYFNRLSPYFSVVCLSLFPRIPNLAKDSLKSIIKISMIVLYFVFQLYQQSIATFAYHNILFEKISGTLYNYHIYFQNP